MKLNKLKKSLRGAVKKVSKRRIPEIDLREQIGAPDLLDRASARGRDIPGERRDSPRGPSPRRSPRKSYRMVQGKRIQMPAHYRFVKQLKKKQAEKRQRLREQGIGQILDGGHAEAD